MQIGLAFLHLLYSLKGGLEQFHIFLQLVQRLLDIFLAQIAFGRRTGFILNSTRLRLGFSNQLFGLTRRFISIGFGYNFSRHGVLPLLFHLPVIGERYHAFLISDYSAFHLPTLRCNTNLPAIQAISILLIYNRQNFS